MADRRTLAQIEAQARIRRTLAAQIGELWTALGHYDEEDVPRFVRAAVPTVANAQRLSAQMTSAYVSGMIGARPFAPDYAAVTGAGVRAGADPAQVYRRPFVNVWTALSKGEQWLDAVAAGRARASNLAAMDVQLTQRATLQQAQSAHPQIGGYSRAADAGACTYCAMIDGAKVRSADAMPLHPGCGCSLEPLLEAVEPTPAPADVAVNEHGELGPMVGDPSDDFSTL